MKKPPEKKTDVSSQDDPQPIIIPCGTGQILTSSKLDYDKAEDGAQLCFAILPKAYPIGYEFAEGELSDIKPKVIIEIKNIESLRVLKKHIEELEEAFDHAYHLRCRRRLMGPTGETTED